MTLDTWLGFMPVIMFVTGLITGVALTILVNAIIKDTKGGRR